MRKVRIANLNLETENIDRDFFACKFRRYKHNSFKKPDMVLKTILADKIKKPQGEIKEQIRDATIVRVRDDQWCRYLSAGKTGEIVCATYYDGSYGHVEIHLSPRIPQSVITLREYEYMYTGFAFGDRLTELGGAVLHGSAIAYLDQGIVFSANSGTGKSTHARLWRESFGSKVSIVNDDKPAIRFYDGIPYIFGTPWSGKSDLNQNIQVPLKALVFLQRAETNRLERLNLRESIFHLMGQISRPYYDEKVGIKTIAIIEKLVQTAPVYRLHCNRTQEAVRTVYQQLIKEGVLL